jgi:hypothetical protein
VIAPLASNDSLPLASDDSPPYHPVIANKKDNTENSKREDEKEDTHSRGSCVNALTNTSPETIRKEKNKNGSIMGLARQDHKLHSSSSNSDTGSSSINKCQSSVNGSASTVTKAIVAPAPLIGPDTSFKLFQLVPGLFTNDAKQEYENGKKLEAFETERKAKQEKENKDRINKAADNWSANCVISPLEKKEKIRDLPPAEKVEVLKAAIEVLNYNGDFNYTKGYSYRYHFNVTKKSLDKAQEFFKDNPNLPVSEVLNLLMSCCFVNHDFEEPAVGEYCEHFFTWKGGASLDFFWNNLANINTYCVANFFGFDAPVVYPNPKPKRTPEPSECPYTA